MPEEVKNILRKATDAFLWEIPRHLDPKLRGKSQRLRGKSQRQVLQSTKVPAARMRKPNEIAATWEELFSRRRTMQPEDTEPIEDENVRATIWNDWCDAWLVTNLTEEQQGYKRSQQTSIFNAYIKNKHGDKCFVFGMLETGIAWGRSPQHVGDHGAAEHVGRRFVAWVRDVVAAIESHRQSTPYKEPKRRSGASYGQHGLTPQEVRDRADRHAAVRNYHWTLQLQAQFYASKGKGPTKGTGKREPSKGRGKIAPKFWGQMSSDERWWLHQLWNGNLKRQLDDAKARHGGRVQADRFHM